MCSVWERVRQNDNSSMCDVVVCCSMLLCIVAVSGDVGSVASVWERVFQMIIYRLNHVAVCRRVLQCVIVCCIVHTCWDMRLGEKEYVRTTIHRFIMLQCVVVCCSVRKCRGMLLWERGYVRTTIHRFIMLQCVAARCSVLECVAVSDDVVACSIHESLNTQIDPSECHKSLWGG